MECVEVCGIRINGLRRQKVVKIYKKSTQINTVNFEFIYWANKLPEYKKILNKGLNVVDSKWLQRLLVVRYGMKIDHLPGSRIIFDFLKLAKENDLRVLFVGAARHVRNKAIEVVKKKYSDLEIYGCEPGTIKLPIADEMLKPTIACIKRIEPHFVFVALGPPKQEIFIDRLQEVFEDVGTLMSMGVGGTFDLISGARYHPPKIVTDLGFEWLFYINKDRLKKFKRAIKGIFIASSCLFLKS